MGVEKNSIHGDTASCATEDFLSEVPERGHWTGRFDFILACLGTAVGLGNVWRFPYLCFKNGGGAFLVPYIIMVFVIGMPVFLVELSLGQYSALGPLKLFNSLSPLFKGLGYAMILAASFVAIYYNMIIGWTLFYFFDSFRSDLQWQYCHHEFNTEYCFSDVMYRKCKEQNVTNVFSNRTCFNASYAEVNNFTNITRKRISAPEEYFNHLAFMLVVFKDFKVLHYLEPWKSYAFRKRLLQPSNPRNYMLGKSQSFEDFGSIRWPLVLSLLGAWIVVVLSLIKGIKTSGRVVYFTATFPYVILIILFIRGVTLEGAADGIYFYIVPDFSKLTDINVWQDAAIQVFYSFSIAGGGMITYASYNRFNNNLVRDVLIIGIGDMLTSLFSGLVVFSMLGFMARQLEKSVADVVKLGTGLAFIAYPDAITRMPVSTLWALLFFFMLFLLGIDSQFAMVETIITFVFDQFPKTRAKKPLVVIGIGTILFLLGLPLTTNGGIYLFEVMDTYAAGWPYLFIGLLELVVVSYVYGISKFMEDLKEMTAWQPGVWINSHLLVTIMTTSPILIGVILLLSWINFTPLTLDEYVFPMWGNAIGWVMAFIPITCIPVAAVFQLLFKHRDEPLIKRIRILCQPTDEWRLNASKNAILKNNAEEKNVKSSEIRNMGYDNPALDYRLSHL